MSPKSKYNYIVPFDDGKTGKNLTLSTRTGLIALAPIHIIIVNNYSQCVSNLLLIWDLTNLLYSCLSIVSGFSR